MPVRNIDRTGPVALSNYYGERSYLYDAGANQFRWASGYNNTDLTLPVRAVDEFKSSSHGKRWAHRRGPLSDVGDNFTMRRSTLNSTGIPAGYRWQAHANQYMAHRVPYIDLWNVYYASQEVITDDTVYLAPLGASAIARTRPGKPESDMLLATIELVREGLPKAIGSRTLADRSLKGASGDWLNYQFGVLPLVSDIKSLIDTARNQDALISKINASSGKPVRRRFEFEPEADTKKSTLYIGDLLPAWVGTVSIPQYAVGTKVHSTRRKVWFSGSFTSYVSLPREDRAWAERTADIAKHLYGARVSPELIWNLTPWTWAADWVTNAGDVVSNASAFLSGDVVMHRGYIMAHTTVAQQWSASTPGNMANYGRMGPYTAWEALKASQARTLESKVRLRANPYHVGFTGEGLDPRQMSILVALGISRR